MFTQRLVAGFCPMKRLWRRLALAKLIIVMLAVSRRHMCSLTELQQQKHGLSSADELLLTLLKTVAG